MQEWYLGWEKVSCLERCPQFRSVLMTVCVGWCTEYRAIQYSFTLDVCRNLIQKLKVLIYTHRRLADTYPTKKSSLRALVDCFPSDLEEWSESWSWGAPPGAGPPLGVQIMAAPPSVSGHSLTHEQVLPFLRKLEQGQLREGLLISLSLTHTHTQSIVLRLSNVLLLLFVVVICLFVVCLSDVLKVLQDLEETSMHSVEILNHFVVSFFPIEYSYDMT